MDDAGPALPTQRVGLAGPAVERMGVEADRRRGEDQGRADASPPRSADASRRTLDPQRARVRDPVLLPDADRVGGAELERSLRPWRIGYGGLTGQRAAGGDAARHPLVVARRVPMVLVRQPRGRKISCDVESFLPRITADVPWGPHRFRHFTAFDRGVVVMPMVRVGVGRRRFRRVCVIGSGMPGHRARRRGSDGYGHRQNGEHQCAQE